MSIKFEHTEVVGWEAAIRGMRNPMNSWEKSDSYWGCLYDHCDDCCSLNYGEGCNAEYKEYYIGPNDLDLMMRLRNSGTDHRKFMRMIVVYVDITAPLYWWKEFDTYKVGTVANSCSTMHKIHEKEFTLEDFSHDHLDDSCMGLLLETIDTLNCWRIRYIQYDDDPSIGENTGMTKKDIWWQMIQLLPSSYNQKRTVMMNYEVLANMYKSRRYHKLTEWKGEEFYHTDMSTERCDKDGCCVNAVLTETLMSVGLCDWIKTLPYSELITGENKNDKIPKEVLDRLKL